MLYFHPYIFFQHLNTFYFNFLFQISKVSTLASFLSCTKIHSISVCSIYATNYIFNFYRNGFGDSIRLKLCRTHKFYYTLEMCFGALSDGFRVFARHFRNLVLLCMPWQIYAFELFQILLFIEVTSKLINQTAWHHKMFTDALYWV